jgi:Tfp pilus assembly protein PilZ
MAEKETQAPKEKLAPCQVTFLVDEEPHSGTSMHFHETGMLILCRQPVSLNRRLKLVLQFPGLKTAIELQGDVVWTNTHGTADSLTPRGMGVKFFNVERETERLLADLAVQYETFASIYACYYT